MIGIGKIGLFRLMKSWGFLHEGEKRFRSDIGMWEQEKFFFGKRFYVYSIFTGELITKTTLVKIKGAKYTPFVPLKKPRIGYKEMKEKYGNQYSVPTNIDYNPMYE